MSDFVRQEGTICDFRTSDSWVILSPIEQSIKRKIEAVGTPLKDWDIEIYRGVLTGCNEAFIISTEKRNEILQNCLDVEERKRTEDLIRPILRGRDIKRYGFDWANLWVICARVSTDLPNNYPAVCEFLSSYKRKGKLGDNSTTKVFHRPWWAWMQEPVNYWEDFFKPKIMYPNMTKFLPFYYDTKGFLQNDKSFMITGNNVEYLTAFLNSSIFKFCFLNNFPELQGGTRELRKIFFDKISVMEVSEKTNQLFVEKVSDIQREYTIEKAIEIDSMLFDLYDLTPEERNIIGFIQI